ncbi:glycerophosphodiester phosphodiesterase [Halalkalibaculum sp. DA384]|uniref:glycerophosphodiester phosphodiesterase n=1 Tax=Halalkalibaculum sp. DA384 TaxID=3373606 RepID=UPI003754A27B
MLPTLYSDNGDNFIVIAHRGASAYFPENTMPAFRGAVEMGAEMIEIDVMMSSDGVPVVFHDATLADHTNGEGELADYSLDELRELDAGSWFGAEFAGEKIPTLEEVLQFARDRIAVNIEIKTEAVTDQERGGVEEKSLELVRKYGMEDHVLFSSFDYRAIAHIKALEPTMPAALLYNSQTSNKRLPSQLVADYSADAFNCSYKQLNRKRLRDIRLHNIPVFVYTVNQQQRMKKLVKMGVTGIFSDKPDLLRKVAESVNK